MDRSKLKKRLKLLAKIAITAFAVFIVVNKIDLTATKNTILGAHLGWLLLAALFFNLSKILSAFRLNFFFRSIDLDLEWLYNLKLYYLGMFYNLFLPGGIGGDGYKVYLLNKQFKTPLKGLITATLLDRVSGVVALGFLAFLLAVFGSVYEAIGTYQYLLWAGIILMFPAYYIGVYLFFPTFKKFIHTTNFQAIGVQGLQLICASTILLSLGVDSGHIDYLTLFLVSSVAAALPTSLSGGIGVRELIFAYGYEYFAMEESTSIALGVLFYLITAVSSLVGILFDRQYKVSTGA